MTEKRKLPPRNYFALPVPRTRQESEPVFHDRLDADLGSGVIELDVETLSPVHVGSGTFGIFQGQLVKELMRRAGEPIVPGSSIKGMCRQVYEVLTDSASPFREMYRKSRPQPLSAAGALFGALGYQGRIGFDDAVLKADVELIRIELSVAYPPQREKGRRFYGRLPEDARQPRKIPALAIPPGVTLSTALRFRNLERREVGGVLLSLGVASFTPKLGGGKYDDYGWARFCPTRYRLREGMRFGEAGRFPPLRKGGQGGFPRRSRGSAGRACPTGAIRSCRTGGQARGPAPTFYSDVRRRGGPASVPARPVPQDRDRHKLDERPPRPHELATADVDPSGIETPHPRGWDRADRGLFIEQPRWSAGPSSVVHWTIPFRRLRANTPDRRVRGPGTSLAPRRSARFIDRFSGVSTEKKPLIGSADPKEQVCP
ncbi:MAG TPA: RAMP superfamily CRISPR-associated protein [Thermoanaerobaculia bacterium]